MQLSSDCNLLYPSTLFTAASKIIQTVSRIIIIVMILFFIVSCGNNSNETSSKNKPNDIEAEKSHSDLTVLSGKWQRTDGRYILEIRDVKPDGSLDAFYFNPGPVNVSRAEGEAVGSNLNVFIELWDEGYPGSTYQLTYDPEQKILYGEYYTPVAGQSFDVIFMPIENK